MRKNERRKIYKALPSMRIIITQVEQENIKWTM